MELYSKAKFKQLAIEYALKLITSEDGSCTAHQLVAEAKIIEEYLISDSE